MSTELTRHRSPLKDREQVFATDVEDAIQEVLNDLEENGWPIPFLMEEVAAKLYKASLLQEDGTYRKPESVLAQKQVTRTYLHMLQERDGSPKSVMTSGAQRVEDASGEQVTVVPVTKYFFDQEYHICRDALDALTEAEARLCVANGGRQGKTAGYLAVQTGGTGQALALIRLERLAQQAAGASQALERKAGNAGLPQLAGRVSAARLTQQSVADDVLSETRFAPVKGDD